MGAPAAALMASAHHSTARPAIWGSNFARQRDGNQSPDTPSHYSDSDSPDTPSHCSRSPPCEPRAYDPPPTGVPQTCA
jgi:hypothetical protein